MPHRPLLVLASASPRRVALLAQAGIAPERIAAPALDETSRPRELPMDYALRMAIAKALAVADKEADDVLVLAADTVVACGRRILPKAENDDEVQSCLRLLSGRRHQVHTALALARKGAPLITRVVSTRVSFKVLSNSDIADYLTSGEGIGKAGGYAIQGRAECFVRQLNGSYSNVVGLPLYQTLNLLQGAGYRPGA